MISVVHESGRETVEFEVWYILKTTLKEGEPRPRFTDIVGLASQHLLFTEFETLEWTKTDTDRVYWYECKHILQIDLPPVHRWPSQYLKEGWTEILEPEGFHDTMVSDSLIKLSEKSP